ncbi:MAG: cache domain-containing protein, partial [Desulfobacteraceae bacterium]
MFFKSLASRIIISTIGIVVVTLTVITLFFNKKLTDELSGEFEKNAMNMIQVTKNQVESHYNNITFYQSVMLNRRKAELKNNSTIAFNILKLLHQAYQEKLIDEETAVRLSIDRIRKLRYDNDTGYFWINDTTLPYPKMIVHPTLPHLDGQILDSEAFNSETATKENLFKVGVELSLANSEGFIEYLWPKPTPDGLTIQQPKISYVKRFEPWDWIIGTGVYIDDIEKDVRFMLHAVIEDLNYSFSEKRFGKNGYIFIVNDKKELLVHPQLEELTFKNAVNQLTGNLLFDDIKESFDNKRKYLDYVWQYTGENTDNDSIKRAYVIFFEPLGWYIICAINPDDFTNKLFNLSKTITLYSVILLSLAMIVSFLVTRSITNPLKKLIKSIQKTDQYGLPIDKIPALGTSETRLLGTIINKMLKTIYSSKIELQKSEAKYRGLIESTIDCVWEMNQDGRYTYVSPQFKNVFGYDVDE